MFFESLVHLEKAVIGGRALVVEQQLTRAEAGVDGVEQQAVTGLAVGERANGPRPGDRFPAAIGNQLHQLDLVRSPVARQRAVHREHGARRIIRARGR